VSTSSVGDPLVAPGPWTQRRVSANGSQFHIGEAGHGPLVLLLHGFPEFWWAWRHQLPRLAQAGFRAVAMDLRGYGGSDKTPRGYDPATSAADVTGVVKALGEQRAVLVGHDWGAWVAWSAAALRPAHVTALASLSMPHPLQTRALLRRGGWTRSGVSLRSQLPFAPERALAANGGARVASLLRASTPPGSTFPDDEAISRYSAALAQWPSSHCALEYQRWAFRSSFRIDGRRYARRMAAAISVPVLQLHGQLDPQVPLRTVTPVRHHVVGPHELIELEGVGHYPPEEAPDQVSDIVLRWLNQHMPG